MTDALKSLARIGHYLVNFIRISHGAPALELAETKEIDRLKYLLEQEKIANAELVKEIDRFEEALRKT